MSAADASEPTRLLAALRSGDPQAGERLLPLVYRELHSMAERLMQAERVDHTLQPTALIHEAWVRLVSGREESYEDRVHFLRVASRAMRQALIDHARIRKADKRGGGRRDLTLDEELHVVAESADTLLAVDEALSRLHEVDPFLAEVVELRFFGGLQHDEIAKALDSSVRTVGRSWRLARAWLLRALAGV